MPRHSRRTSTAPERRARALSSLLRYLVDSDWLIDALHGLQGATEALERLSGRGLAVSIITIGELYEGAYLAPDPEAHLRGLRQFLSGFVVLTLTETIMAIFARERARLRRSGNRIPDLDLLIASTALQYDLTLLTRNRKDFSPDRFPSLRVYQPTI